MNDTLIIGTVCDQSTEKASAAGKTLVIWKYMYTNGLTPLIESLF